MPRITKQQMNRLAVENRVQTLWSWSRYKAYKQDRYEYFLRYVLKAKEDKPPSIYGVAGNHAHSILESYYNGQIPYEAMTERYNDALLLMALSELKFAPEDEAQNAKTAAKYECCMRHFFQHHQPMPAPRLVEAFALVHASPSTVLHGYIDFMHIEGESTDRHLYITDFKTSTAYSGKKIGEEAGQLLLYAEALRQKTGLPVSRIHIRWNFLKYVNAQCEQANGSTTTRRISRHEIAKALSNAIRMWLKKSPAAYTGEQIEQYIAAAQQANSLAALPPEVKGKFILTDCYVDIPLTQQAIDELLADISATAAEITAKTKQYKATGDESLFWQAVTPADTFRLCNLSGYSRHLHKPYDAYLKEQERFYPTQAQQDAELAEWLAAV